ncbi:MAG: outer membrane beta-barrel protein [Bacteroidales bacterium]|nr:outer membrane beta-barrel protein [Bacteroidales bacterium]
MMTMMPKLHTLVVFVVFLACLQKVEAQMFRGGLQMGATASEVSGDDAGGADRLGWYVSVFTNRDVGAYSRVQLELMYIQKGSRVFYDPFLEDLNNQNKTLFAGFFAKQDNDFEEPGANGYRDYRFNLHYIEVPLLFIFDFSSVTGLVYVNRVSGKFGVSASTVVGHYEESLGEDITEIMAGLRPFRAAELNLLAGLYYPLTDRISFQMRFSQGITPLRTRYAKGEVSCTNALECYRKRHQFNTVWTFGLSYTMFYAEN